MIAYKISMKKAMQLPVLFEKAGWQNLDNLDASLAYIIEMNGSYCGQYDEIFDYDLSPQLYDDLVNIWINLCRCSQIKPWNYNLPVETIVKSIASSSLVSNYLNSYLPSNLKCLKGVEIGGGAGFMPVSLASMLQNNILLSADVFKPFQISQKAIASIASEMGFLDQLDLTNVSSVPEMKILANLLSTQKSLNKQLNINSSVDFIYESGLSFDYIVANDCLREFDQTSLLKFLNFANNQLNDNGILICFGFGAPTTNQSLIWNLIDQANLHPIFIGMKNLPQTNGSIKSLPHQTCIFRKDIQSLPFWKSQDSACRIFPWLETATADKMELLNNNQLYNAYYLDKAYLKCVNAALRMEINLDRNDLNIEAIPGLYLIK